MRPSIFHSQASFAPHSRDYNQLSVSGDGRRGTGVNLKTQYLLVRFQLGEPVEVFLVDRKARLFLYKHRLLIFLSRIACGGRTMPPGFNSFTCPNCQALHQVVRVEAGPETNNREITCSVCGAPLLGRKGKFVLKYFPLRKAIRSRRGA